MQIITIHSSTFSLRTKLHVLHIELVSCFPIKTEVLEGVNYLLIFVFLANCMPK